jgi:glycosyltransferase involved in cell wall biosynthesis
MKVEKATCYSFALNGEHSLAHLRLIGPLRSAGINLINGIENNQININRVSEGNIVVIQRDFPKEFDDYKKILDLAHKEGKPVVFDLDDLLFYLPENHPDRQFLESGPSLLPMFQTLMEADLVSVATPGLRDFLITYNENVAVLPNYLDDNLWQLKSPVLKPSEHETLTIGYMGGNSHRPDLEFITPVLVDLIKRYPREIRFQFWGAQPPAEFASLEQVQWTPVDIFTYKDFSAFFQTQTADIFIAPLFDNQFNRCKSPIKFLEYSALGVPGIYSHLETYMEVITHGHNGLLAASLDEWTDCLIQLIEDKELRFNIAKNAQETIKSYWLLSQNAFRWEETYRSAFDNLLSNREKNNPIVNIVRSINMDLFDTFTKKEATLNETLKQLAEKEATIQALTAEKERVVQALSAQVNELERVLQEIYSSRAWRLIQLIRSVRLRLIPHGSRRERSVQSLLRFLRRFRQRPLPTDQDKKR